MLITGDCVLECLHWDTSGQQAARKVFAVAFNTAFLKSGVAIYRQDDLDIHPGCAVVRALDQQIRCPPASTFFCCSLGPSSLCPLSPSPSFLPLPYCSPFAHPLSTSTHTHTHTHTHDPVLDIICSALAPLPSPILLFSLSFPCDFFCSHLGSLRHPIPLPPLVSCCSSPLPNLLPALPALLPLRPLSRPLRHSYLPSSALSFLSRSSSSSFHLSTPLPAPPPLSLPTFHHFPQLYSLSTAPFPATPHPFCLDASCDKVPSMPCLCFAPQEFGDSFRVEILLKNRSSAGDGNPTAGHTSMARSSSANDTLTVTDQNSGRRASLQLAEHHRTPQAAAGAGGQAAVVAREQEELPGEEAFDWSSLVAEGFELLGVAPHPAV